MREGELTGSRRFRACQFTIGGLSKPLVLQVEYCSFARGREDKPGRWVCLWRDATTDDLTLLEDGFYV